MWMEKSKEQVRPRYGTTLFLAGHFWACSLLPVSPPRLRALSAGQKKWAKRCWLPNIVSAHLLHVMLDFSCLASEDAGGDGFCVDMRELSYCIRYCSSASAWPPQFPKRLCSAPEAFLCLWSSANEIILLVTILLILYFVPFNIPSQVCTLCT
jgi:hypothetical protein